MNQEALRILLEQATPEMPADFDAAMRRTLAGIVAEENAAASKVKPLLGRTRLVLVLLIVILLLASAAVAAIHFNIFDTIFGKTPINAAQVMQGDIYKTTVNNVEITIKEAGYDGMTMYLLYSYRMLDVDTPLGMYRPEYADLPADQREGVVEEDLQLLRDHRVGWWIDHIWFDGVSMDMPSNSGGITSGSMIPGEIVEYQYWRLDNEDVFLNGEVEISLPIGEWQPLENFSKQDYPEKYDSENRLLLPEAGMVTFTLDVSDMRARVTEDEPNIVADLSTLTAKAAKVSYTPIMMYVTLELDVKQSAMDAFIAENGEGWYFGENDEHFQPYSGMDVFSDWIFRLKLVDGEGNEVFPDMMGQNGYYYGNNGYGDHWAEFLFPYAESYPDEMWLAPMDDHGAVDMAQGIRVR